MKILAFTFFHCYSPPMASARILPKVGPTVTMSRSLATTRNVPRTAFLYYQCRGPGTYQAPFPECHGQRRGEIYSAVPWTWVAISAALVGVACAISSHDPAAPRRSNLISHVLGTRPVELSFEKYPDSIQQVSKSIRCLKSL